MVTRILTSLILAVFIARPTFAHSDDPQMSARPALVGTDISRVIGSPR